MNKRKFLILCISALLILTCFISIAYAANSTEEEDMSTSIEMINSITNELYGEVELIETKNSSIAYDDTYLFEDDNYMYLVSKDGEYIKSIIPIEQPKKPLLNDTNSSQEIVEYAKSIAADAFPELIESSYDIFIQPYDIEGEDGFYSIELWSKIDDETYSGRKISIIITVDGYLELLTSRDSDFSESKLQATTIIDQNAAIDIAYSAAESRVVSLEQNENYSVANEQKPILKDDLIIPDSVLLGQEEFNGDQKSSFDETPYKINIMQKNEHIIKSYKEFEQDQLFWVITISNVTTNKPWGPVDFIIKINAINGNVEFVTSTR